MRTFVSCFIFTILLANQLFAQRIIAQPEYDFRNSALYKVQRIELTQQSTKIEIVCEFVPGWWTSFTQEEVYIENADNGDKYHPLAIEGAEWKAKNITPASGVDTFLFTFPPLPGGIKKINWVDGEATIFGIHLEKKSGNQKKKGLALLEGNWWTTDGTNLWTYGIYPQFIIADNRFWNYEVIKEASNKIVLNLTSEGQKRELWITPQKDGSCKIGYSKQQQSLYANHKSQPSMAEADGSSLKEFFQPGSKAYIQGYIQGYDLRAGFTSGLIYNRNCVIGENAPVVVNIDSLGRFSATLPLDYPVQNQIIFDDFSQHFYIEPGDTLTLFIEWEDWLQEDRYRNVPFFNFRTLCYMGPRAKINADLNIARKSISFNESKQLKKQIKKYTPQQFKDLQLGNTVKKLSILDSISKKHCFAPKSTEIMQTEIHSKVGILFFDFVKDRNMVLEKGDSTQVLQIPISDDYYNFMQQIPMNDERILTSGVSSVLLNRFEFSVPFRSLSGSEYKPSALFYKRKQARENEVYMRYFSPEHSFLYDITKIHQMQFYLRGADLENANELRSILVDDVKHPYLKQKVQDIVNEKIAAMAIKSTPLPEGKSTEIFRKIIDKYKGKVIYVDFWGIFCGPCRAGIERMASVREKYRDKDIVFLFITDVVSSPLKLYEEFMANVEGEKYRISQNDYNYLCELFRFNAIPHYEIIDKKGDVVNRAFYPGKTDQAIFDSLLNEK